MILISGSQPDLSAIAGEYAQNSVERLVLNQMSESAARYRYDSLRQLRFELSLRREIVAAARALNQSRMGFAVFHKSRCNPAYWDRTDNGGFQLKAGAKPHEAINDIFVNGSQYATECATAMVIVYYKALLGVFGAELFDRQFQDIYLMDWHVTDPLLSAVGTPRSAEDILLGDRGYFANPDVDPETPQWQGENVIVLPGPLYYGHGIGIETADRIISALNGNRRDGASRSAYFLDSAGRPDFKRLADVYYRAAAPAAPQVWRPFPAPIFSA